jgi:hypothetical protein
MKMDLQNIQVIEQALAIEKVRLTEEAESAAAIFWEYRNDMLEVNTGVAKPTLGCRVVKQDGGIRMTWYYHSFYKRNGVVKRTNVHIKKAKGKHQYALTTLLKKALPNEAEVVEHCEKRFSEIRKQVEALRKLNIALTHFKKAGLGDDYEKVLGHEDKEIHPDKEFGVDNE